MVTNVVHSAYTAKEATEMCSRAGVMKANMRIDKIFMSAFMAGCILSFACAAVLITTTAPWFTENAPGLLRMVGAAIFPFGLVAIVLTGADLCTGSFLFTTVACLHGRLGPVKMLSHWTLTFFGNLAGSLFIMALVIGYGDVLSAPAYTENVISFTTTKVVTTGWHAIFLRGIGANWLVCLACFLAFCAREFSAKVVAIWLPTFAFVCLGFDHVVANMFFVPMGIFLGNPQIGVGYYIWKSMIPALIGNIVGGGLFVGVAYWYFYLQGNTAPIAIDGELFPTDSAPLMGEQPAGGSSSGTTPQRRSVEDGEKNGKSAENMV